MSNTATEKRVVKLHDCMNDAFRLSYGEISNLQRLLYSRLAALDYLGVPRNEVLVERLSEVADFLAQWKVECHELQPSRD